MSARPRRLMRSRRHLLASPPRSRTIFALGPRTNVLDFCAKNPPVAVPSRSRALLCDLAGLGRIVIINLMLLSVVGAHRESGFASRLGSRRRDILRPFIVEAGDAPPPGARRRSRVASWALRGRGRHTALARPRRPPWSRSSSGLTSAGRRRLCRSCYPRARRAARPESGRLGRHET